MDNNFVDGIVPKKGNKDFVVCNLNFKVNEFAQYLIAKKQWAEDNNGWLTVQILRTKNDPDKYWAKFSDFKPQKQVSSAEHSPDREVAVTDDLPF